MKKRFALLVTVALAAILCVSLMLSAFSCESDLTGKNFTISYTDYDGDHEIEVRHGFTYEMEEVPSRFGYEFLGLYNAETEGELYVKADGSSVSEYKDRENIKLYPRWKAKEYTVVLNYGGGSGTVKSVTAQYGQSLPELPASVELAHNVFKGWYTENGCGGVQIADTNGLNPIVSIVNEDNFNILENTTYINLYAGYETAKYTVTLNFGSGMSNEQLTVEYGTAVEDLVYATRNSDKKAVLKWSRNSDLSGNDFTGIIEDNVTLYAKEWANAINFDCNGGEPLAPVVKADGANVSLPVPQKENYKFLRWENVAGGTYEETTMPTESITLKAVWQAKIVFDCNGGSEVDEISKAVGESITLPVPSKEDYIFAGWYTKDGEKYTATAMPAEGIKLYAKYYAAVKKTVVLLKADQTEGNTLSDPTSPNTGKQAHQVDLSEIYNAGVKEVKITAHYRVRYVWGNTYGKTPNSATASMNYYYQSPASDAYKLWGYSDSFNKDDNLWRTVTQTATIPLKSSSLFICRFMSAWDTTGGGLNARWKDFYIEIEYADTSAIF